MSVFRSRRGVQLGARQVRARRELQSRQRRLHREQRRTPSGMQVAITTHLVTQWINRVDPEADRPTAGAQIQAFLRFAEVADEAGDDGLYLASPGWPSWVVVVRPKSGPWWLARTVLPRLNVGLG